MRIYGHRGARGECPENTLEGFRHAIALGCDGVELDLRPSADDVLVVIHDDTLDRTTNARGPVAARSAHELGTLDPGDGAGILSIDRLLDACPEFTYLQLETKPVPALLRDRVVSALMSLFERPGLADIATVTSFDVALMTELHRRAPHIPRGYICEAGDNNEAEKEPLDTALSLEARVLALHVPLATPERVQRARTAGLEVSVWTVNDLTIARDLVAIGVDSLITDVPRMLISALRA